MSPAITLLGLPIGNIEDTSLRVLRSLFTFDIILAEDTRELIKFKNILKDRFENIIKELKIELNHEQRIFSYRDQNHDRAMNGILQQIETGKTVALVSDSGMPAISDPGWKLIDEIIRHGLEIDVIPGPTALITSLVQSGMPTDRFAFIGFLPRKTSKIVKLLTQYLAIDQTVILYESPFRIISTLETIQEHKKEIFEEGDITVSASSELTKLHQYTYRGNVEEVLEQLKLQKGLKGEWVVCLRNSK
jgi:16S rRNA (cytidine1402-2'-O)-methyltransferase